MTSTEIKKRPGNVIVFRPGFIRPTATPQGGPQAIHRPQAIGDPLSSPSRIRTGGGSQWRNQARLHNSFTFIHPYALRMQPYAVRMHFLPASKKLGGSRAESTCKKPYALYAPLLGVGVFSAFFLLREVHTVHTAAYGRRWNRALALLPVGIGASLARENRKCIRRCIRLFGRKTPIDPLLSERRDLFGMASEPMDGIRPCGPSQGPLPRASRRPPGRNGPGRRRGPGAPDA